MPIDYHILPKFRDGLSYVYIEHCKIDQDGKSISCQDMDGEISIPCATLALLLLGPGTSITHAAMKTIAENGCTVLWVGEEAVRFYASGFGETRHAWRLLRQADLSCNPEKRILVVRKMYQKRFGDELNMKDMDIQELRGLEGVRVRSAYANASKQYGVPWDGRIYKRDDWRDADPVNRALSCANACLYGVCHAAILSAGLSPALGFIHTGKQLSFVYDIADLYKLDVSVPVAFSSVAQDSTNLERRVRVQLREIFRETKLLPRIVSDMFDILDIKDELNPDDLDYDSDAALPAPLWDGDDAE